MNGSGAARRATLAIYILFAAVAVVLPATITIVNAKSVGVGLALTIGIGTSVALGLTALIAILQLQRVREIDFRIAMAGLPGAGKTVYVNVLCGQLAEGLSSLFLFSAETRTSQAVVAVLRGLRNGKWPESTRVDNVNRYLGNLNRRSQPSVLGLIAFGQTTIRLELGDSAGDYWAQKPDSFMPHDHPLIVESTYFDYVANCNAIFYFIKGKDCFQQPQTVERALDDLVMTLSTMRPAAHTKQTTRPSIAIIISQADEVTPKQLSLLVNFGSSQVDSAGSDDLRALNAILRLRQSMISLGIDYKFFAVSSTGGDIGRMLEPVNVVSPLDWALRRFASRRS